MKERVACAQLLAGVDFVGLLLNSVLANSHARSECRYAAAACLREITSLCGVLRTAVPALQATASGSADRASLPANASAGECCAALEELTASLCLLLQHIVRQIGMPAQKTLCTTVIERHMLRLGLSMLIAICQAVPSDRWASCESLLACTVLGRCNTLCQAVDICATEPHSGIGAGCKCPMLCKEGGLLAGRGQMLWASFG